MPHSPARTPRALARLSLGAALLAPAAALAQGTIALGSHTFQGLEIVHGTSTFAGTLSQEFRVVGGPIRITGFGAFDDGRDGFLRDVTVRLYDASTEQQVGDAFTFTAMAGTADGAYRFLDLASAITLPVGFVGRIAATGYGSVEERYYNGAVGPGTVWTDTGGGLIAFGRVYYSASAPAFPDLPSGNQAPGWYGAANFRFEPAAQVTPVPEPASVALLGAGLVAVAGSAARRRRSGSR